MRIPLEIEERVDRPYPGLRPFQRGERYIFFGRDEQIDYLLNKLHASVKDNGLRLLAVVGPSGCGKSSLVRAGVIDALETGFFGLVGSRWRVATTLPRDQPMKNLTQALLEAHRLDEERCGGPVPDVGTTGEPFSEYPGGHEYELAFLLATLRRGPLGLVEALRDRPALAGGKNLLLLVDQFEEIFRFRRASDRDEADAFVRLLLETAAQQDPPAYIILTMRSDYLGDCALFPGLPEALNDHQFLVPRLTREQRQKAIEGPARVFDGWVEPELVERLLNDMGGSMDQLPLMQHVLMRLWMKATNNGTRTEDGFVLELAHYEEIGGITRALDRHANEAYERLKPTDCRMIAQTLFRCLTERDVGQRDTVQRDTRQATTLDEIAKVADVYPEKVAEVAEVFRSLDLNFLTPFVPARLTSSTLLDISHESLIRQWNKLQEWVDEEARSADMYRQLWNSTRLWKEGQEDLWTGLRLDRALEWRSRQRPRAAWARRYGGDFDLTMSFLDESNQKREADRAREEGLKRKAQRNKKFKYVFILLFVCTIVFGILLWWALQERERAVDAEEKAKVEALRATTHVLTSQSRIHLDDRAAQRSLILAVEALNVSKPLGGSWAVAGEEALRRALRAIAGRPLVDHKGAIMATVIDPCGRWVATGSSDKTVRLWDLSKAPDSPPLKLKHAGPVIGLVASPDGRWLAAVAANCPVRLWGTSADRNSGPAGTTREFTLGGHVAKNISAVFSPAERGSDARWLLTISNDAQARLWDLATARPGAGPVKFTDLGVELGQNKFPIIAWAFSPDGDWLAISKGDGQTFLWTLRGHDGPTPVPINQPDLSERRLSNAWFGTLDDGRLRFVVTLKDGMAWVLDNLAGDDLRGRLVPLHGPGEPQPISVVATDFEGRWVITAGSPSLGATARLWDLQTDKLAAVELGGYDSAIHPIIEVSAQGVERWLIARGIDPKTRYADNTIRLWNLGRGRAVSPIILKNHVASVNDLKISPDGHWLITGSADNTARIWDLTVSDPESAGSYWLRGHDGPINSLAVSPDSRQLVTASDDCTARIWDLKVPKSAADPEIVQGRTVQNSIVLGPDSRWLAAVGEDGQIQLWDLKKVDDAGSQPTRQLGSLCRTSTLVTSPDRRWLTSVEQMSTLGSSGFRCGHPGICGSAYWARTVFPGFRTYPRKNRTLTGSLVEMLSASGLLTTRLWDLKSDDPAAHPIALRGLKGSVASLFTSTAGDRLTITTVDSRDDTTITVWNLDQASHAARRLHELDHHQREDKSPLWRATAMSGDGRWLLTISQNSTRLLDLESDRPTDMPINLKINEENTRPLFSDDGRWLAVVPNSLVEIYLWELKKDGGPNASPIKVPSPEVLRVTDTGISPNGRWLVTTGTTGISPNGRWLVTKGNFATIAWDLSAPTKDSKPITLAANSQSSFISPRRSWFINIDPEGAPHLWNLDHSEKPTERNIPLPGGKDKITEPMISSDDRWLVALVGDTAAVWDLHANPLAEPVLLQGHGGSVKYASVRTYVDGCVVAISGSDSVVRLWDLGSDQARRKSGQSIIVDEPVILRNNDGPVSAVVLGPCKRRVVTVTSGSSNTVRFWTWQRDDLKEVARRTVWRNLSEAEWKQLLPWQEQYSPTFSDLPFPHNEIIPVPSPPRAIEPPSLLPGTGQQAAN